MKNIMIDYNLWKLYSPIITCGGYILKFTYKIENQ